MAETAENRDAEDEHDAAKARVNSSTRVSVAFPFSKITVNDSNEELRELAALVVRLAQAVAAQSDDASAHQLARDAERLQAKLDPTADD